MGVFRRKNRGFRTKEVEGHDDLVAMHEDDLFKFLDPLNEQLFESLNSTRLDEETERWLGHLLPYMLRPSDLSHDAGYAAYVAARMGYFTRREEFEQVEEARGVCMPLYVSAIGLWKKWLQEPGEEEEHHFQACLVTVATGIARDDPLNPGPDDRDAMMWAIPGLGAQARQHFVKPALMTAYESGDDPNALLTEIPPDDLARTWVAGFIFCHLHELFDDGPLAQQALDEMRAAVEEMRAAAEEDRNRREE